MSFGVATLRAVVHASDKTSRDAGSWYMISGDAKSWVCDCSAYIHYHIAQLCVVNQDTYTLTMLSHVMSTPAYVDLETITQADGAQSSREPTPLPNDPYVAVRQAQLVDTNTESDPEEAPLEAEESQPLGSGVPLTDEEFKASEPSGTRTDSSYSSASSDSTTPLSPDHPLTQVSPTPTPTRASFHRKTARMTVRTQPAMSPGLSARVTEAMALSDLAFCTSELILDTDSEGDELGDEDTDEDGEDEILDADDKRKGLNDEGHGLDDKGHGLDDESHGLDDEDHGLKDEGLGLKEEVVP
ncbi:hypothetical protein Tco_1303046 [Tanacetum coccineum]